MPEKEWIDTICEAEAITDAAVFMKDSLIPIVGEENMRLELPREIHAAKGAAREEERPLKAEIECWFVGREVVERSDKEDIGRNVWGANDMV